MGLYRGLGRLKERHLTCNLLILSLIRSRVASGLGVVILQMQLILELRSTMGKSFFFFGKSRCNGGDC